MGIPAAEADLTTAAAEETRAIAEKFVAALVENNTDAIAACAGEAPETYQNWRGMSIPTAEITETLEEYDGCGRYRVHMAVENAFGVFAKGEEDLISSSCSRSRPGDPGDLLLRADGKDCL